jgi:hypothetical protein
MKHAHLYLGAIVVLHAACAALWHVWFWNSGGPRGDWMISPVIYWIPLFCLILIWCRVDSNQRNAGLPIVGSMLVALFFPLGVPYYFFRTYSRRLALIRTGQFLLFVATCVAASWLGGELTHRYYAVWTNREL